jgi:hypothetical protein
MSSGGGPAAGTPVFAIGSLHGNQMGHQLFLNSGSAPTEADAIRAVEAHFNANVARPSQKNAKFIAYKADDGSVLVEVTDGTSMFGSTFALYKVVPSQFGGSPPMAGP